MRRRGGGGAIPQYRVSAIARSHNHRTKQLALETTSGHASGLCSRPNSSALSESLHIDMHALNSASGCERAGSGPFSRAARQPFARS